MTKEELYYLPASELLKHIQTEKERLIEEKAIKKSKPLPTIMDEEKPYELPEGWEWVRLGEIINYKNGFAFSKKHMNENGEGIPVIKSQNIMTKKVIISKKTERVSSLSDKMKEHFVSKNDLLMVLSSQSSNVEPLGVTAIYELDSPSLLNQRVLKMSSIMVNTKYIYYVLNSPDFHYLLSHKAAGSAQANLKLEHVLEMVLPLPPLYIQDQIVQKLESLSETKDSLLSHAESQLNYTKKMREALLQEAIRGELVPQKESDEPVSVLLEQIKTEKERLIKDKVIKKSKELPPITEDEKPYDLPSGWEWVRLDNICTLITDGAHHTPTYIENGIPFLSVKDITKGIIDFSNTKFISNEEHNELCKRCNPEYGDVLLTKVGTTGIAKMVDTKKEFSIFVSVALLKLKKGTISPKYLEYTINSPFVYKQSQENTVGVGNKNLVIRKIKEFLIPLPPLAEQERIVHQLDELIANCNQLEAKAEEMKNYTMKLFEASLKEAFMPE